MKRKKFSFGQGLGLCVLCFLSDVLPAAVETTRGMRCYLQVDSADGDVAVTAPFGIY